MGLVRGGTSPAAGARQSRDSVGECAVGRRGERRSWASLWRGRRKNVFGSEVDKATKEGAARPPEGVGRGACDLVGVVAAEVGKDAQRGGAFLVKEVGCPGTEVRVEVLKRR